MRSATGRSPTTCDGGSRRASSPPAAPAERGRAVAQRTSASRVTVRRALEVLRDEGLVDARQGFGWFVAAEPRAPDASAASAPSRRSWPSVGRRGRAPDPRLRLRQRATRTCAPVLGVEHGAAGAPAEPGRRRAVRPCDGVVPGELGAGLSRADVERAPFYELLDRRRSAARRRRSAPALADGDRRRAARGAGRVAGAAVRARHHATSTADPVLLSEHVFPAHRTEFVVDLPSPAGLNLVE